MFRQSLIKTARPVLRSSFSTSGRIMAAGDTGSTRPGGVASGDAFSKREKGMEDYAIRERERAKIQELLKKIEHEEDQLTKLKSHIQEVHEQWEKDGRPGNEPKDESKPE